MSFGTFIAWAVPICHVLGALSALAAVMRTRTSQGAIAWALSLIFIPYVALPFYWVFGYDRFEGYRRRLRLTVSRHRGHTVTVHDALNALRATLPADRAADQAVIERISGHVFTRGNTADLLIDGRATYEAIFEAVRSAERDVLVQYYILRDDEVGHQLADLLVARLRKGVRVMVLYDNLGSFGLGSRYAARLREAGADVYAFRTARAPRLRIQINFRNHRKAVIVDGKVGFVGGINIGREYLGLHRPLSPWRDTHLRISGPAVMDLQRAFAADWYWAAGGLPNLPWTPPIHHDGLAGVLTLPSGPADDPEALPPVLLHLINSARTRLWIATPYFVPDPPTLEALRSAAFRGVDVRLILPGRPDTLPAWLASFTYLPACTGAGVRVFRYTEGFMHQKVWLIDDDLANVGTVNIDNRSMRLNFEQSVIVCDRGFAARVQAMLHADLSRCREVGAEEFTGRSWPFRLSARLARLLEPVL